MSDGKINAIILIELLGRPADYAEKVLKELVGKTLAAEKGVEILSSKISKPKQIEGQDIFSLFAEIELELENIETLLVVVFKYMPSHVEVVTPEILKLKNDELNLFANELTKKLHQYDEIAKAITMERNMLKQQLEARGEKPIEVFKRPEKKKVEKKTRKKVEKKKVKKK